MSEKRIKGKTLEEWIAEETSERETTFWGDKFTIKPVLVDTILGDGLQLAYLGTIDQRPHYWLIRIDSKTDMEDEDFDYETILEPIEECCGRVPEEGYIDEEEFNEIKNNIFMDCYESYEDYKEACEYPHVYWQGGHYGSIVNFGE